MSTASYRGPQTGLWIGDEDPCVFRQCSKVAVQHGSHGDDHGTSGDSSSSSGSSGGGGGGGGGGCKQQPAASTIIDKNTHNLTRDPVPRCVPNSAAGYKLHRVVHGDVRSRQVSVVELVSGVFEVVSNILMQMLVLNAYCSAPRNPWHAGKNPSID